MICFHLLQCAPKPICYLFYQPVYCYYQNQRMKTKSHEGLTYEQRVSRCQEFIRTFEDYDLRDVSPAYQRYGRKKYLIEIQKIANGESKTVEILFEDLEAFFRKEDEKQMVKTFKTNVARNVRIFTDIIHRIMPEKSIQSSAEEELKQKFESLLNLQRKHNIANQDTNGSTQNQRIPYSVLFNFDVYIVFGPSSKIQLDSISELSSDKIGSLVVCKAIVTRISDIKPELEVATYACDSCGFENYQEISDRDYRPLAKCMSKRCEENKVNGKLTFLPGHSTFKEYQEIKVQETPDQLNIGKIPKSFMVHVKGFNCKKASPGDVVLIQGVLLPIQRDEYKGSSSLSFTTYLEAYKITREKKKYIEMSLTQEEKENIRSVCSNYSDDDLFKKLSRSIAPEIFGMDTVKKALLLLMAGGITKTTEDNLRIRGQINIGLIGDPGIAKSQLLKHIAQIAPRGVYTSGKGSSGVGLTAAITIDPFTREVFLQAGALVLADMGVCCIDEFDKMSEYDRTAIHEVMEQQTVSIAKAGITTSLNARASILAAANPLFGRYNRRQSVHKNINLPAALLSRFDLIFILLDQSDKSRDKELATHIGRVHQNTRAPQSESYFDPVFLRHYIALSKELDPQISGELHKQMIDRYIQKRQEQTDVTKEGENLTTMRSLLALIRLSQARAKLRFSNQVTRGDIMDCLEIIDESQRVMTDSAEVKTSTDVTSNIFTLIKSVCNTTKSQSAELTAIEKRVLTKGFSLQDLERTLAQYQRLNVIMLSNGWVTLIE